MANRVPSVVGVLIFAAGLIAACTGSSGGPTTTSGPPPPPACNGYGTFGPGCWPPASFIPYDASSPFNAAVAQSARLRNNSAEIVQSIIGPMSRDKYPSNVLALQNGLNGEPTYWIRPGDTPPMFTLACRDTPAGCAFKDPVPIPAGAVPEAGTACAVYATNPQANGPDCHMIIADQVNNVEYDLYHVSAAAIPATGGTLDIGNAAMLPLNSGDGTATLQHGNSNAAGFGELAGRVRAEEVAASAINHALYIGVYCQSGEVVYPAVVPNAPSGGICGNKPGGILNTAAPPLGAWLRVKPAILNTPGLKPWELTYLNAMVKFGMYVGDTTSLSSYFQIESEAGIQYTSLQDVQGNPYPDEWLAMAPGVGMAPSTDPAYPGFVGLFNRSIDWASNLEVICNPKDKSAACTP